MSAVFLDRPIRETSGMSLAPCGVEVTAHASSSTMALPIRRSMPFSSRLANWETR